MIGIRRVNAGIVGACAMAVVVTVSARTPQPPPAPIAARADAFFAALASAKPERFEAMAQESFAPAALARRTPAERRQLVERIAADFGTLTKKSMQFTAPGSVVVAISGSTGLEGRVELVVEPAAPHRITSVGIRVEQGAARGSTPTLPPPIEPSMDAAALSRALDSYIAPMAADGRFSGVVLVAREGAVQYARAWGKANRDAGTPNTTATRFQIGSINKVFTKAAIGQLLAEGKLALTDTIGKVLPDYPNPDARTATIDQLLRHRAGIADFFGPAFDAAPKDGFASNADYYRFVAPQPLRFAPGTRTEYCNGCYIVLGAMIERLTGIPYERYVTDHVFRPSGMTASGFFHSDRLPPDVAHGYTRHVAGNAPDTDWHDNRSMHGVAGSAAGGAYATAADLLALDSALRTGRLLDRERTAWFFEADVERLPAPPGRVPVDLGVAGGAPGENANVESDGRWTIVVMANIDPPAATELGAALRKALTP